MNEPDQARNLKPTAEAIVAMCIWGNQYSRRKGGSMDFYDSLTIGQKKQCAETVQQILDAPRSYGYQPTTKDTP